MQTRLIDTHEQLQYKNTVMTKLLEYIYDRLQQAIRECKQAPLDKDGLKDIRKVNTAGFCVQLLDDISKQKEKIIKEGENHVQ